MRARASIVPRSQTLSLAISADQASLYDMYVAAGSPSSLKTFLTVTVNAGKILQRGLSTGGPWPTGSTLTLINNGTICGLGGAGGNGDSITGPAAVTGASDGAVGGSAVSMSYPLTIDNTNGTIQGGGGGGGGGGMSSTTSSGSWNSGNTSPGGGGGGGRGYNNAAGGTGGTDAGGANATNGTAGASTGAGAGGGTYTGFTGCTGGTGGAGAGWGTAGSNATDATGFGSGAHDGAGQGGAAGNAVKKNGYTLTWVAQGTTLGPVS